jgi:hypothetical protein
MALLATDACRQTAGLKTSQNLENCIEKAKKAGRKKFRIMYLRVRKEN